MFVNIPQVSALALLAGHERSIALQAATDVGFSSFALLFNCYRLLLIMLVFSPRLPTKVPTVANQQKNQVC